MENPSSRRKLLKTVIAGALATGVAAASISQFDIRPVAAAGPPTYTSGGAANGQPVILGFGNDSSAEGLTAIASNNTSHNVFAVEGTGSSANTSLLSPSANAGYPAAILGWGLGANTIGVVAQQTANTSSPFAPALLAEQVPGLGSGQSGAVPVFLSRTIGGNYIAGKFKNQTGTSTGTSGDRTVLVDFETGDDGSQGSNATPFLWRMAAAGHLNGLSVPQGSLYFEHPPGIANVTFGPTGNVGIGTTSPQSHLFVVDSTTNPSRGVVASQNNSGAQAALMQMTKSRGTQTSPTAVANGDYVGAFNMNAFDGTSYLSGKPMAGWGAKVNGTVAAGSIPTDLFFYTKPSGTLDPYGDHVVRFIIASNGNIYANGSLLSASDMRLKTDIEPIDNALDKVLALNGVYFHWNKDAQQPDGRQVGVIAQNVQQVLPEVVSSSPASKDYLSVDYTRLVPVLIQAMKEQQEQFKNENEKLHERIAILERTVKQFAAS
jgi:hypothetical protein